MLTYVQGLTTEGDDNLPGFVVPSFFVSRADLSNDLSSLASSLFTLASRGKRI